MTTKERTKWWERIILAMMVGGSFSFAAWAWLDLKSLEVSGFIPSMYAEEDVTDVLVVSRDVLNCWVVSEEWECFRVTADEASPFYWDMFDTFFWMPGVHTIGEPFETDTDSLGRRMGMDWPEEERRDFANSRTYEDDRVAVVLMTSMDVEHMESQWRTRLYEGESLPYLKNARMAEVHTVIAPSETLPGAGITFYLRYTELGWRLFDWDMN